MLTLLLVLFSTLRSSLRSRAALQAEILALRHQLLVLQRSTRGRRLRLRAADRLFWVWLSRVWQGWRLSLRIIKPETVIAWNRKGFRLYWTWRSRARNGRPCELREVRELIRRISVANPRWGAPRIHGELMKLGIDIGETTVAKYMIRPRHSGYSSSFSCSPITGGAWCTLPSRLTPPLSGRRNNCDTHFRGIQPQDTFCATAIHATETPSSKRPRR
jgi:hypothetical protein